MRDHYEKWWAGVEPGLNDFLPISIGSQHENPVALSSSDWEGVYCDNVQTVSGGTNGRLGGPRGGPWNIYVERDGEYEVALSRWPPHLSLALTAGRPAQKMTAGTLPEGKALPIAGAGLSIAGHEMSVKTQPSDSSAVFRVKLKGRNRTKLHGWFVDAAGADLVGAYYASVRRL
jgi:arylsulfatase